MPPLISNHIMPRFWLTKAVAMFLLLLTGTGAMSTNVTIIESQSFNSGHVMDVNWQTVATGMGYTASINPQATLLTNTWFATTDILIVSSGVINLPQQAIDTIQSFVSRGGHVFIQTEYLTTFNTNGAFQAIVNNLGGSFSWVATSSGTLAPMIVSGSLSTTPNAVTSLSYFWYGDYATGNGCNSRIEPFLQYQGLYYGFIFAPPTGTGRMITTCDQDWVNNYTTTTGALPLMQNILANLATLNYTITGSGASAVTVSNATVCNGQAAVLTATPVGATGGTYLWSPGGATTQSISVSPSITTQYIVNYTTGGCGTVADTATVTISTASSSAQAQSICSGGNYNFNGQTLTTAGTYTDTLTNARGCDSVITLTLTVLPVSTTYLTAQICSNGSYNFYGRALTTAGTYTDTLISPRGCDSVISLTLTVVQISTTPINAQICSNGMYNFYGQALTTPGTYSHILTGAAGCDSTIVLTLSQASSVNTTLNQTICNGSNYNFNGQTLTTAGIYTDTLTAAAGCDSIVTLTLVVVQPVTTVYSAAICSGSAYNFNGQTLTVAGTYTDTLTSAAGCDSIVVLTLSTSSASATSLSASVCSGSSYNFNGQILSVAGTYYDTLTNIAGCDSLVTLNLTVVQPVTTMLGASLCSGSSMMFAGQNISTAGVYTDTLAAASGCDSIIVLNVNVLQPSVTAINGQICTNGSYNFNGQVHTTAGTYTDTLTGAAGCDSVVTLTLTVVPWVTTAVNQSICSGYSYNFNGQVLTAAGTYTDTLTSAAGCDSIVVLTLTIIPVSATAVSQTICGNNVYNFNGRPLSVTGTYTDTLTNALGCDSVVTLSLTIVPVSLDSNVAVICSGNSYTFNGQPVGISGIYRDTLTGSGGCDSIVVLALSVVPKPEVRFVIEPQGASVPLGNIYVSNQSTGADTYSWQMNGQSISLLAGGLLPITQAGNYCLILSAAADAGCAHDTTSCVTVYDNSYFIPNAFTPNADGVNDYVQLFGTPAGMRYVNIAIFDRWGEKVFQSNDPAFMWNGTYKGVPSPAGVYVYELNISFVDGNMVHNKGSITLMR